jgi:choline dehydrogenase
MMVFARLLNLHIVSSMPLSFKAAEGLIFLLPVDPVISRSNLVVLEHALVSKLNVSNPENNLTLATASGTQIQFPDNTTHFAKVSKDGGEVILSAGTIRTPQLLELSGIGQADRLFNLRIEPVLDLPGVGEGYEDQ